MLNEIAMDGIHVFGNGLSTSAVAAHEGFTTYSIVGAVSVAQFPPLGLGSAWHALRRAVARRYVWVSLLCRGPVGPVVHYGASSEASFWVLIGTGALDAFVLLDSGIRAGVGLSLLRVEGRGQGIDLALQLGDTAVGFLLALPRRRGCDACAVGFGAAFAGLVWPFLVATYLEPAAGVAGARALQVVRRLAGPGGVVGAVFTSAMPSSCRCGFGAKSGAGHGARERRQLLSRTRRARRRRGRLHRATRRRAGLAVTSAPGRDQFVGALAAVRQHGGRCSEWAGSMVLRHCAAAARRCRIVAGQESAAAASRTVARASDRCCLP